MKHFISSFSAAGLLAVMIISSCELPAEPALDPPVKSLRTSITGEVKNRVGNPVDGVLLSAGGVSGRSDKWGEFTIEGAARIGTVTLSAKKAGYKDYRKPITPQGRETTHDIQLAYAYKTTGKGALSGLVDDLDDKSGILIESSTGGKTARTDSEGKYTIEVEHAGEFTLIAVVPDKGLIGKKRFTPATTPQKPVSKQTAEPIALEEALRSFTLVLKDPLGNPIPGYTAADFESSSGFPVKITGTVTNGIYPLQVTATESFTVTVGAKDLFGKSSLKVKYSDDDGKRYEVRVPYQYTSNLEGKVTAGKRPIAGATITAASHGSGAEERRAVVIRSRRTDSAGRYRIVVNHQGPFNLQAEKPGYKSDTHEFSMEKKADGKYDFETGRTYRGRDIALIVIKNVTGLSYTAGTLELLPDKALTSDQAAALRPSITPADARVTYSVSPKLPAGLTLNPSTGEITGTPTAITAAGDYLVTAQGNDEYDYAGEVSHTINIRVGAVTRFTLELRDHLGNPIPGYTAADFTSSSGFDVEFDTTAPAAPEGSYKLQVLTSGSGDFTVTVRAKGLFGEKTSDAMDASAAAGKDYSAAVPYRYTTTVSGRVTRGITPTPIDDADISVTSTGSGANERLAAITSAPASRKTDNPGRYSITVNHQGDFTVRAEKAGYNSPAAPVTVSGTGGIQTGKNIALTQPVTGLSYTASTLVLAQNEALTPAQAARLRPRITPAGAVIKYSVSPRLPKGLILNAYTGEITGTPTEESQIHTGTDYLGRDYTVTAQGHTAAGYSGSASHTINIRVGRALPDTMGYDTPFFFYGEKIILDHELSVERLPEDTTVGLDDEDFHAEFVKIPKNGVCWDLNIAADGRITLDDGGRSTGMTLIYHYKVKVIGKGRYVGKRTVDFEIHTTGRIYSDTSYRRHTCYE